MCAYNSLKIMSDSYWYMTGWTGNSYRHTIYGRHGMLNVGKTVALMVIKDRNVEYWLIVPYGMNRFDIYRFIWLFGKRHLNRWM